MKLILLIWSTIALIPQMVSNLFFDTEETPMPVVEVSPSPITEQKNIHFKQVNFAYYLEKMDEPKKIDLINNLDKKESSAKIIKEHGCKRLINGGFYDANYRPLGWLVTGGVEIGRPRENRLFNGFLAKDEMGKISLGEATPAGKLIWGIQSGPMLLEKEKTLILELSSDKPARRSVAALTNTGEFVWMAVFDGNSNFDGPQLSDLPEIVKLIGTTENIQINSAVNLDGGSASAFYSPAGNLPEFSNVGSVMCEV